jgi:hypothetical protein
MAQHDTTTRPFRSAATGPVTESSTLFDAQELEPTYADFIGEPATLASPRLSSRARAS